MIQPAGSTSAESPETVAPSPPPRPDPPARNNFYKWRARFVVLLMILAAAYVAYRIVQSQASHDATLDLGNVTLTSQPIPVMSSLPGLVTSVDVRAGQQVVVGQQMGAIRVTTTNSQGKPVQRRYVLRAPRNGIVVDDPMTLGATLQSNVSFVDLYDPNDMRLVTNIPLAYLPQIAPGTIAKLKAQGLPQSFQATVLRAVPRIGDSQLEVGKDRAELVLVPKTPRQFTRLLPGLRFTGTVDTRTAPDNTPKAVYVN